MFTPQLKQSEAIKLAELYDSRLDEKALQAGIAILGGAYDTKHLPTIFCWKTKDRGKSRIDFSSDSEIAEALKSATCATEPRSAIAVLAGLGGVGIPVASAIATVIHPNTHTILDVRALEALGCSSGDRSIGFYLKYRSYCHDLAGDWEITLRNSDRALWQWSKERGKKA